MKAIDDFGYRVDDVRAEVEESKQRAKTAGTVEIDISRFER